MHDLHTLRREGGGADGVEDVVVVTEVHHENAHDILEVRHHHAMSRHHHETRWLEGSLHITTQRCTTHQHRCCYTAVCLRLHL